MPLNQARPDIGFRPRHTAEGDEEVRNKDAEATAGDLYRMLGYRVACISAITIQQWVVFRLVELQHFEFSGSGATPRSSN